MKKRTFVYINLCFLLLLISEGIAQQNKVVSRYQNQQELTANNSIVFTDGFHVPAGANFKAYISSGPGIANDARFKPEMNAVVTYNVRVPGIIDPTDPGNGVNQVNVDVQTLDHFGRVVETQSVKASPHYGDVINLTKYHMAGMEKQKHLPYVEQTGFTNFRSKGYEPHVWAYYGDLATPHRGPSIAPRKHPYSSIEYDNSELNRVVKIIPPGDSLELSSDHAQRITFMPAENDVLKFRIAYGELSIDHEDRFYFSNNLNITMTMDEDATEANGAVYEYKNLEGQLILKRQSRMTDQDQLEWASTYYVYDDRGNLGYVLPAKSINEASSFVTWENRQHLTYQYKYDELNRMIAKRLPGKDWEFMVYNKQNKLVMSQDAIQRKKSPQEWNIFKYDALGRTIITGIYTHLGSSPDSDHLADMQAAVNLEGKLWEDRVDTGNGYTNHTFPKSWTSTLSLNYYDNYNFPGGNVYPYAGNDASSMTRGLLTASSVNVLGTNHMLWTVNYYDGESRLIRAFNQHYKGAIVDVNNYDEIINTYDFTGAVLTETRIHKVAGTEQLKLVNEYDYDHRGRRINTWKTINAQPRILLAQIEYDDLGQVYKKKLHSKDNGASFLQTISHFYNTRGWLSRMEADKLDIKIRYEDPIKGGTPRYNGNISEVEYTGERSGNRWFTYAYDGFNRLTHSVYSNNSELNETIKYDVLGNILSLTRGLSSNVPIHYNYANGGMSNQLTSISGGRVGAFTYDVNGSLVTDGSRSVSMTYNHLNLPSTVNGAETATYVYNALGNKLKSVQGSMLREYINGIQYSDNVLDFVGTEEGRAVRNPSDGIYRYEYNLKDYLGNVRVSIDDSVGTARVIQEDEFYAFGLNQSRYTYSDKNNYLYNGKEKQDALTDEYDYGARFYDPVIGRWHVMDPLAEKFYKLTPYNYADNNPANNIDPDGMDIIYGANSTIYTGAAMQSVYSQLTSYRYSNRGGDPPTKKGMNVVNKMGTIIRKTQEGYSISRVVQGNGGTGLSDAMEFGFGFTPIGTGLDAIGALTGETVSGEGLSWWWRVAGLIPLASEFRKGAKIISVVKKDAKLLKLARETFEGNDLLRKEANDLVGQLSKGNMNPGIGTKQIEGNIFEARSKGGARVYFKETNKGIEIVGYSNKNNQQQVINRILKNQ